MPRSGEDRDRLAMAMIFGLLIGVVISSLTGQWWWLAIGVAVGAAIEGGRSRWSGPGDGT
jgi:hypothetical protein